MSILELRRVEARYGEIRALHDVSITIDDGDFVAILGANGAGKTTTLRAVSGTVKTSGDVLLDGSKIFRRTPESMARRGVAHVPEGRGTFTTLSVLDNLRLGAWVQRGVSQRDTACSVFSLVSTSARKQQAGHRPVRQYCASVACDDGRARRAAHRRGCRSGSLR